MKALPTHNVRIWAVPALASARLSVVLRQHADSLLAACGSNMWLAGHNVSAAAASVPTGVRAGYSTVAGYCTVTDWLRLVGDRVQ